MVFRYFLLKVGVVICALTALVSPVGAQSLQDALTMAYHTNPQVQSERARLQATSELRAQALAELLPRVTVRAGYTRLDTEQVSPAGEAFDRADILDQRSYGASIEQVLFSGGRGIFSIREAVALIDSAEAELIASEQRLLADVVAAYFDVVRDTAFLRTSQINAEVLRRQREQIVGQLQGGEVARTDLAQADARLAAARGQLATRSGELAISRARYVELIGQLPATLESEPALPQIPASLEEAQRIARELAPEIIAARAAEKASRHAVRAARGAYLPQITAAAGYDYEDEPSTFIDESENVSYGVRLEIPLYEGGARGSRLREAKSLSKSARYLIAQAEREVASRVTTAWEQLQAARLSAGSAQTQIEASQQAVAGVRKEASVGSRTNIDILNAQLELVTARNAHATAQRDLQVAHYQLLEAIGLLTPRSVGIAALPGEHSQEPQRHGWLLPSTPVEVIKEYGLAEQSHTLLEASDDAAGAAATTYQISASPRIGRDVHLDIHGAVSHRFGGATLKDDSYAQIEAGPRFTKGRYSIALKGVADRRRVAGRHYLHSAGARLELAGPLSRRMGFRVHTGIREVSYRQDRARSGIVANIGARVTHSPVKSTRLELHTDYRWQDADGQPEQNQQASISFSYDQRLAGGWQLKFAPAYLQKRFDNTSEQTARKDMTTIVSLALANSNWQVFGLLPVLRYSYLDNDSTSDLYDYRLHITDVSLVQAL